MGTTAAIGLGILAWVLLAILVALFLARLIRLRDRQYLDRTDPNPGTPAVGEPPDGANRVRVRTVVNRQRDVNLRRERH